MKLRQFFSKSLFDVLAMVGLLGSASNAEAKNISVDPNAGYNGYGNELYLETKPEQNDITYSTIIPASRLAVYENDASTTNGADNKIDNSQKNFRTKMYPEYRAEYSGVGFDTSNPTSSDYIETFHGKQGKFQCKWVDVRVRYSSFGHIATYGQNGGSKEGVDSSHAYLDVNENLTNDYVFGNIGTLKVRRITRKLELLPKIKRKRPDL